MAFENAKEKITFLKIDFSKDFSTDKLSYEKANKTKIE